jgi:hypothetical protein
MWSWNRSVLVAYDIELPFKQAKNALVDQFERAYVVDLMQRHGGNLSAASRESGLSRRHLRDLLKKFDMYDGPLLHEADDVARVALNLDGVSNLLEQPARSR